MARNRPSVPQMRGVTDLLSMDLEEGTSASTIPIGKILFSKQQPRRYFDPEKLAQLAQSVREHGILEPLLVRPSGSNYELIAGERRYRAAQAVGLKEVPVIIREFNDQQALQVALIENLQRDDLNPVEETEGILQLLSIELGMKTEDVVSVLNHAANAKKRGQELTDNVIRQLEVIESLLSTVGRFSAESFRVNRLPLLNLPLDILEVLRQGRIEFTKARAIARVKDEVQRTELIDQAISQNLSLNQIKAKLQELMPVSDLSEQKQVAQQLSDMGKRLQKSQIWSDRKKKERVTKLLDELNRLIGNE